MDIVIISEFCEDFSKTDNDRFLYLAKELATSDRVEIITSSFRHTTKSQRKKVKDKWDFKITFLKEPGYPKNVCLRRFYSHYIWGKQVEKYLKKRKKPDVVYCAVPSLSGPLRVAKYCKKENIRFVIDVQDLWPEAFQMIVNIPVVSSLVFAPFKWIANGIYKRADAICAVSNTYCERALKVNKKATGTNTVFLGTNLDVFDSFAKESALIEKKEGEIWLAYCGTLGSSYDLKCVIDAMVIMNNPRVRFVVMGDGPKMEEYKTYATEKKIAATFTGRLPYNVMCSLLKKCDIAVNPISHGAAQSIINKHADYAAAGIPVVSTQESDEYRRLVDSYQMGLNCNNGDEKDLSVALNTLVDNANLREQMGRNARRCAIQCFDRATTYKRLYDVIIRH